MHDASTFFWLQYLLASQGSRLNFYYSTKYGEGKGVTLVGKFEKKVEARRRYQKERKILLDLVEVKVAEKKYLGRTVLGTRYIKSFLTFDT